MAQEYKWRLTWAGQKDTPKLRACVDHCKVFPLFKDSEAHLVTHEEYTELVEKGEVSEPESYWGVNKGEVGLVSLSHYSGASNTWDKIATCKSDFFEGWERSEKMMKLKK